MNIAMERAKEMQRDQKEIHKCELLPGACTDLGMRNKSSVLFGFYFEKSRARIIRVPYAVELCRLLNCLSPR